MKRTLAIWLLGLGTAAIAQNPAVVQKNAQAAVNASTAQNTHAASKPSPSTVKVVAAKPAVVAAKPIVQTPTAQTKTATVAVQAAPGKTVSVSPVPSSKPVAVTAKAPRATAPAGKPAAVAVPVKTTVPAAKASVAVGQTGKSDPFKSAKTQPAPIAKAEPKNAGSDSKVAVQDNAQDKKTVAKSVGQAGRRDPFVSPIVAMGAVGSGCSSGKRCLAIDQVSLRGIVKSDNGMIAVVVNATDKAYFLRENDPVFNGYVVKITGDSIVFKETFRDKLGKPLTRDITKTISRPVA